MTKNREPVSSLVMYHYLKWSVVAPMLGVYFRGRIYGAEKVPTQGPIVVASNHASNLDPPLVSCSVGRPVAFMAKRRIISHSRIKAMDEIIWCLSGKAANSRP